MPKSSVPKRPPGRPRKNPAAPMSTAERQAARRQRQRGEIEELRRTVAEQAKEIERLRELTGTDDETQRVLRNILLVEGEGFPGPMLRLRIMRIQLLDAHRLARTVTEAMERIKGPMYHFAVGGGAMKREVRKEVFADLVKIDDAARKARHSFESRPHYALWMRGEREWR